MAEPEIRWHAVLLSGRFQLCERRLYCSRARLYADRLLLTGWHGLTRFRRRIPLTAIRQARVSDEGHLHLTTRDEQLCLALDAAPRWRRMIEAHRDALGG
ncbi:MAG: hypothetical protein GVY18_12500 [Bacteroidetes bacterium]|jgi:hypothetical protein|nr:hypothetical protein [Bacteroidota bacterium]